MTGPLKSADFPLRAIGPHVYRRTESSPLFTAGTDELAADLALRLNRDDTSGYAAPGIPIYASRDATDDVLGDDK